MFLHDRTELQHENFSCSGKYDKTKRQGLESLRCLTLLSRNLSLENVMEKTAQKIFSA